jgi:agmatinase
MAMTMTARQELTSMLRPAGGGIFTVTTGRQAQLALQRQLYQVDAEKEPEKVIEARWLADLDRIASAHVLLLGVPCDTGAGLIRGQNLAPEAIRQHILENRLCELRSNTVVDLGDVRVVPHLLVDEMLSAATIADVQRVLYQGLLLPVSPLSVAERVATLALTQAPHAALVVMGGDHSVAWPIVRALVAAATEPIGIVQFDAHTDLLAERLGVTVNFATWAYHANDLVGRGGRLVQIGIRTSSRPREHWERELGVKQMWAEDVKRLGDDAAIDEIVAHLRSIGVRAVYISNDIDGTDPEEAPATAAAEPGGLTPKFVCGLIRRLGEEFRIVGGDIMEVAPRLGDAQGAKRTLNVAAAYLCETIAAASLQRERGRV